MLKKLPRVRLSNLPTPLYEARNLSAILGGPQIFIKREDLTGLGMGGNKSRKLDFVMADAKQKGADVVISCAGAQSNWCLQMAAAARRLGMEASFVLIGEPKPEPQGNLLLQNILNSKLKILSGSIAGDTSYAFKAMEEVADELRKKGRNPLIINPLDASSPYRALAVVGWVEAAEEIWQQLQDFKVDASSLVLANGSGGTQAGLALGAKHMKLPFEVIGISVFSNEAEAIENVVTQANETADLLGLDTLITADEVKVYGELISGTQNPSGAPRNISFFLQHFHA
ncbi:L-cysteate sulfo-lyase [subsurface metagenome]